MEQAYYTIGQASQMLQIAESTIYKKLKDGSIPRAKFCGKVLIPAYFFKQGYEENALTRTS